MQSPKSLPTTGFLRLPQIIGEPAGTGLVPVSRATWYSWIKQGHAPAPLKIGPRAAAWKAEEIHAFIKRLHESAEA
ncbi:helix-turn-helix transcriptional regulator [Wenzhouxiangella marina]|uniref:helix-turn-helix transcriptional regulator n=1 Tax=Wenzhouxiangella marina TaxID=1579979 RepID=UPI0009E36846|nr:AlpA family phage regulatory protein [Wenzhouxiangella marina]